MNRVPNKYISMSSSELMDLVSYYKDINSLLKGTIRLHIDLYGEDVSKHPSEATERITKLYNKYKCETDDMQLIREAIKFHKGFKHIHNTIEELTS